MDLKEFMAEAGMKSLRIAAHAAAKTAVNAAGAVKEIASGDYDKLGDRAKSTGKSILNSTVSSARACRDLALNAAESSKSGKEFMTKENADNLAKAATGLLSALASADLILPDDDR